MDSTAINTVSNTISKSSHVVGSAGPGLILRLVKQVMRFGRSLISFIGTLFTIGFSVLPLAAMLVALPAVSPNEAVLTDTVRPTKSWWGRLFRRLSAVASGLIVLIALFAFSIEVVSRLPLPEGGQLATLAKKILGLSITDLMPDDQQPADFPKNKQWLTPSELMEKHKGLQEAVSRPNADPLLRAGNEADLAQVEQELADRTLNSPKLKIMQDSALSPLLAKPVWTVLPTTLIQHWPFVLLLVYATDLALLLLIGKVPLAYNLRYLWVRKRDTILTAVVFTVVIALVIVLLAFVNGMYKLNENTGIPGNVMVLSEGSTDELFSNLGYSDVNNVERIRISRDEKNRPLPKEVGVQRVKLGPNGKPLAGADGKAVLLPADASETDRNKAPYLVSYETYLVMNQPVPTHPGEPHSDDDSSRCGQLKDVSLAAAVHNMDLYPGGKWFDARSVEEPRWQAISCLRDWRRCCGHSWAGCRQIAADSGGYV